MYNFENIAARLKVQLFEKSGAKLLNPKPQYHHFIILKSWGTKLQVLQRHPPFRRTSPESHTTAQISYQKLNHTSIQLQKHSRGFRFPIHEANRPEIRAKVEPPSSFAALASSTRGSSTQSDTTIQFLSS